MAAVVDPLLSGRLLCLNHSECAPYALHILPLSCMPHFAYTTRTFWRFAFLFRDCLSAASFVCLTPPPPRTPSTRHQSTSSCLPCFQGLCQSCLAHLEHPTHAPHPSHPPTGSKRKRPVPYRPLQGLGPAATMDEVSRTEGKGCACVCEGWVRAKDTCVVAWGLEGLLICPSCGGCRGPWGVYIMCPLHMWLLYA